MTARSATDGPSCALPGLALHAPRYAYRDFAPTYTAGSVARHVFWLACQLHNDLAVVYVSPTEAAVLTEGELDFESHALTILAHALRLRRARLNVHDKAAFLAYYNGQSAAQRAKAE